MLTDAELEAQLAAITCGEQSPAVVNGHQHACRRLIGHPGMHRCPSCTSRWWGS